MNKKRTNFFPSQSRNASLSFSSTSHNESSKQFEKSQNLSQGNVFEFTKHFKDALQCVNPTELINDYRQRVSKLEEDCIQKHQRHFIKVSKGRDNIHANNKQKIVLKKHLNNIKKQQDIFLNCMTVIKLKFTDAYCKQPSFVYNKCEEILEEANYECKMFKKLFPIYAYKDQILSSFKMNQVTIILVDSCYGASEIIPLFIFNAYKNNIISCLLNSAAAMLSSKSCKMLENDIETSVTGLETEISTNSMENIKILFTSVQKLYSNINNDSYFTKYSVIILQCDLNRTIEMVFLLHHLKMRCSHNPDFKLILLLSQLENISKFESYFCNAIGNNNQPIKVCTIITENINSPVQVMYKKNAFNSDMNYITEIVDTALAIHTFNKSGDILVFLPSSSDVEKVNILLTVASKNNWQNQICCVVLHNSSELDLSQFLEMEDTGKRKIFLTENWAEFLPLPSVAYVIDSGLQQNLLYDHKKFSDVLNLNFISKTRAKLRKYCAGRYNTGICYRLYNKYNYNDKMMHYDLPEVFCKNPLDIVVRMFQYDAKNAKQLELFDSLSDEEKNNSLVMLENANAIEDNRLTWFGQRITKLPFLPKYSKLIVLGIDWGFSMEAIVLVAFFMIKKSVFICSRDKNIQKIADSIKLQWLSSESDTITNIYIYNRWLINDYKKEWCDEHAIDYNVLIEAKREITTIKEIVKQKLKFDINCEMNPENEGNGNALQDMIYKCFEENLCIYTGHYRSGYKSVGRTNYSTFLHPSSLLFQNKNLPEYVVFDHLQITSCNFMIGVTAIPKDVIDSHSKQKREIFPVKDNVLTEKLEYVVIENVGLALMKHILSSSSKGQKLTELEKQIKADTKCEFIIIEPSEEKGNVTVFAPSDCIQKAEKIMRNILEINLKSMLQEEEESILKLKRGQTSVSLDIIWTKGATITELKTLLVDSTFKGKKSHLETDIESEETNLKFYVNLMWLRRYCKGYGFVKFTDGDFYIARRLSCSTIWINNKKVSIQLDRSEVNQLYISKLPDEITTEDLRNAINTALNDENISVLNANIVYCKPFETTFDELKTLQDQIYDNCKDLLGIENFTVAIQKPKNDDLTYKAVINMHSPDILEQSAILLKDILINNRAVKAEAEFYCTSTCSIKTFKALQEVIDVELTELDKKLKHYNNFSNNIELFKFTADVHDHEFACLKFSTYSLDIMNLLQNIIYKLLEGTVLTSNNFPKLHKLFTHGGHLWLKALEESMGMCIMDEYKSQTLRLYGTPEKCIKAHHRIEEFLLDTDKEIAKQIDLSYGNHIRILLKALIREYGINLKKFIEEFELRSAEVNIRAGHLIFQGDSANVEKAYSALEQLASTCSPATEEELMTIQEACSSCCCPPFQSSIRLEYCGHLYCAECLNGLIKNAKFPILCGANDCNKELIIEDIRRGLDYNEEEIEALLTQSLTDFISKHTETYSYCPAPDCSMFYDKKEVNADFKWHCKLCQNDICVKCNVIYHSGMNCDMYEGSKHDSEYSVKVWMKERNADFQTCSRCGIGIEKNQGCNHMNCSNCNAHICWLCGVVFPTGKDVYNHLPYCKNQPR